MTTKEKETKHNEISEALLIAQLSSSASKEIKDFLDMGEPEDVGDKATYNGKSFLKYLYKEVIKKLEVTSGDGIGDLKLDERLKFTQAFMSNDSHKAQAVMYIFMSIEAVNPWTINQVRRDYNISPIITEQVESAIVEAFSMLGYYGHIHNVGSINESYTSTSLVHVGRPPRSYSSDGKIKPTDEDIEKMDDVEKGQR